MFHNKIKRQDFYKTNIPADELYEPKDNSEGSKYVKDIDTRASSLIRKGAVITPYQPNFVGDMPEIAIKDLQDAYNAKMSNLAITDKNLKRTKEDIQFLKLQKERELIEKAKKELSNEQNQ